MVQLVETPIEAGALVDLVTDPAAGAIDVFLGIVRNNSAGKDVRYLEYEAYTPMALKEMGKIEAQVRQQWDIHGFVLQHRLGRMEIGEASVGIAIATAHRGAAFEATRFAIDRLKQTVPIWKKEYFTDGVVWVEGERRVSASEPVPADYNTGE